MIPGASLTSSFLLALAKPRWWLLALASFLVRGGILAMVLPIVTLPTPSGVTNAFGPAVTGLALGGAGADLIALIAVLVAGATAALIAGSVLGAWLEATLVGEVLEDVAAESGAEVGAGAVGSAEVVARRARATPAPAWRGAAVRLIAHVPLVLALIWGVPAVIEAGYAELILPRELITPLALRIAGRVPEAVALIVIAWLVGEVVGGLALRRLVRGDSVAGALGGALGSVARRPFSAIGMLIGTQIAVLALALPALVGSGAGWDRVRILLGDGIATTGDQLGLIVALMAFVGLWLGGYLLVGLGTAVRAVAWTTWSVGPGRPRADRDAEAPDRQTGAVPG